MKRIITLLLFVLSLTIIFTGCASLDQEEKPVEEFVEEGMKEFNGGDYVGAIVVFEELKDWYPFSKYAILAELKIADSYFHGEKYEDAIFAYEDLSGFTLAMKQLNMSYFRSDIVISSSLTHRTGIRTRQEMLLKSLAVL